MKNSFMLPNGSLIEFGFDEKSKRYFFTASGKTKHFKQKDILENILDSLRKINSDQWMIRFDIDCGEINIKTTHVTCYGSHCTYKDYIFLGYINNVLADQIADSLETLLKN